MHHSYWLWIGFTVFVVLMVAADMLIFQAKSHEIRLPEALAWSVFWTLVALAFNWGVYWYYGKQKGLEFLTGYIIERSLSVDNIFVFLAIFTYFEVDSKYQPKILIWGVLGALVFRAIFILAGISLIQMFSWTIYGLGALLVVTGVKLAVQKDEGYEPGKNPVLKLCRRFLPLTESDENGRFFVKKLGRWMVTPLFLVLVLIETTDVVFATDSVPAVLAISQDPFIVYTSNIFAILGLRALYFAVAGLMKRLRFLQMGLAIILVFTGIKMIVHEHYPIPIGLALGFIVLVLTATTLLSFLPERKKV